MLEEDSRKKIESRFGRRQSEILTTACGRQLQQSYAVPRGYWLEADQHMFIDRCKICTKSRLADNLPDEGHYKRYRFLSEEQERQLNDLFIEKLLPITTDNWFAAELSSEETSKYLLDIVVDSIEQSERKEEIIKQLIDDMQLHGRIQHVLFGHWEANDLDKPERRHIQQMVTWVAAQQSSHNWLVDWRSAKTIFAELEKAQIITSKQFS